NVACFDDPRSPGGARNLALIERAPPFTAARPPQAWPVPPGGPHRRAASLPSGPAASVAARDRGVCRARKRAVPVSVVSDRLPVFPWDRLEPYKATAAAHPDGIVDLSVGTPVDPVPEAVTKALTGAADSPGYPTVWGTPELRDAIVGWAGRRLGARGVTHHHVLPVVGSKE